MHKYLKTAYQFGVLGGILSFLSFLVLSFVYEDPTNLNLVFGYLITPIAIFLAIKFFKDYTNAGYLSFAEGMTMGFMTYFLIGSISAVTIWAFLSFSPELFESIRESKWDVMQENKETILSQVGEDSYLATQKSLNLMSTWDVAFNDGLWKIIPGMFFSIIISIILRKNPT
ncbi:DUF4199 domain-containing protein [Algoriphagus confluentis]|uniref:DUF4199 domain-containing protein n=1 Tax=Algoriphagus confluentis TaxID=1697556 RepID=A0ABQ6PTC9_9BACT|nr:hypothetical protein Aconfl_30860 [Algoriphagus confluentis]